MNKVSGRSERYGGAVDIKGGERWEVSCEKQRGEEEEDQLVVWLWELTIHQLSAEQREDGDAWKGNVN